MKIIYKIERMSPVELINDLSLPNGPHSIGYIKKRKKSKRRGLRTLFNL